MASTEETFDKAGGPAFPSVAEGGSDSGLHPEFNPGMTLRDWFAGRALPTPQYYMRDQHPKHGEDDYDNKVLTWEAKRRAAWCYAFADAMLAERVKKTGA